MGTTHRTYTAEFKARVVLELISGKKSWGQASRDYKIKDSVISRWRQEFLKRSPMVFETTRDQDGRAQRIDELERVLGRMTVQLEMAKKYSGIRNFCQNETRNSQSLGRKRSIYYKSSL